MAFRFDTYRRLQPGSLQMDLQRGFRAEAHDPAWFLGRQWQLGEHLGEDASSPVEAIFEIELTPIESPAGVPDDPREVPPEVIVEAERDDWWTPGRRVRLGIAYAQASGRAPGDDEPMTAHDLAHPYDRLNGTVLDGWKAWREDPGHAVFAEVPASPLPDHWDSAELIYGAEFTAAGQALALERHDGGPMDWFSVDAVGPRTGAGTKSVARVIPTRFQYPGAPHPRWWQIEDAAVDIGGFAPDRGHFATLLLIELLASHGDNWFTVPLPVVPGHVVDLAAVQVRDSFDRTWKLNPPADWSLFSVRGLPSSSLLLWPTVSSPVQGTLQEDVVLGIDEDANLLWAVELRANGRDLATEPAAAKPAPGGAGGPVDGSARKRYAYNASRGARPRWHPYVLQDDLVSAPPRRRFIQGRAADLTGAEPRLMPEPQARVLRDLDNWAANPADQVAPAHWIEPSAVPPMGLRLRRRYVLARDTLGAPRLWAERRRLPLQAPPASTLRWDALVEE